MARIYQCATLGEAHIKVALVADRAQADLLVCRVASMGLAVGDAKWLITREKQSASSWVYFTSVGMADVTICFVDIQAEAGWQSANRFKGRF